MSFLTRMAGSILITGANGGLGSAIVKQITSSQALAGYHGLYTVRNSASAPALATALQAPQALSLHRCDVLSLDLTRVANVRKVAADVNTRVSTGQIPPIRALILNAGLMDFGKQAWTEDRVDVMLAANYLGHWLLVLLLLKSMDKDAGRIIFVGSAAHDPHDKRNDSTGAFTEERNKTVITSPADFEAIARGAAAEESLSSIAAFRSGYRRYGASKLFLTMAMHDLKRRLVAQPELRKIQVIGVDPGVMASGLTKLAPWYIRLFVFQIIYPVLAYVFPNGRVRTTRRSADDVLHAAFGMSVGPEEDGQISEALYLDGTRIAESSTESRDEKKQRLVWSETVRLVSLKEGDTVLQDWQ